MVPITGMRQYRPVIATTHRDQQLAVSRYVV